MFNCSVVFFSYENTNLHRDFSRLKFAEADLQFPLHVDARVANVDISLRDGVTLDGNSPTLFLLVVLSFY